MSDHSAKQSYRLEIRDMADERIISNDRWQWRLATGAAVSIKNKRYRVRRVVPHATLSGVDVVWVEKE